MLVVHDHQIICIKSHAIPILCFLFGSEWMERGGGGGMVSGVYEFEWAGSDAEIRIARSSYCKLYHIMHTLHSLHVR